MKKKSESMKNSSLATLSRRQFLQATAATCLAASMMTACSGGDSQDDAFVPDNNDLDFKEGTWHKSYCGSCIWTNCGTEIKVQNGVAIELRGNKQHPANKGTMCTRGAAMLMSIYNPWRIKTPMKRTNPNKGVDVDPGWVEITWEEAMNTITGKMAAIQEPELAPMGQNLRKMLFMFGFSSIPHEGPMVKLILPVLGMNNVYPSAGPLCEVHHSPFKFNGSGVDRIDLQYCNYLLVFGRNIGTSTMFASGPGRALADALERGMKLINFDPHAGADVSKGGEWMPIRPASDMALGMAMLHVMLHEEDVYDEHAMKWRSNAPYLITDDGHFLREPGATSVVDTTKKPLIWDAVDNTAKPYDDPTLTNPDINFSGTVNGVHVETGFIKLKASVLTSTPEWAEPLTDISADDIRRITNEFIDASTVNRSTKSGDTITIDGVEFPFRPAAVVVGRGAANNVQGQRFYVLANIINHVLGGMGVPGSTITASEPAYLFEDGIMRPHDIASTTTVADAAFRDRSSFNYTGKHCYPLSLMQVTGFGAGALNDPAKYGLDYNIEILFPYGSNAIIANAESTIIKQIYEKMPFIFTVGYSMDETAMYCDIVLPEHSQYERTQIRPIIDCMAVGADTVQMRGINYREPVINPVYNTRQFDDIVMEMADAFGARPMLNTIYNMFYAMPANTGTGLETPAIAANPDLDPGMSYTYKEMIDKLLKAYTQDSSKGTEWFKENGFFMRNTPLKECYEYYAFQVQHADQGMTARLPLYNWEDYVTGEYFKDYITTFNNGEIPGWEGQMDKVFREFTPVPAWYDNYQTIDDAEFDMYAINWKITVRNLGLCGLDDNPWLREIVEKQDFDDLNIQMNPETAAVKGLRSGDKVKITSQTGGEVTGTIKLTNLIHKGCLGFPAQAGRTSIMMNPMTRKGVNYNQLLSNKEGRLMPDAGAIPVSVKVKIEKA